MERPKLEQAIQAVCGRLGIQVKRVPQDHAGGKWRLSYTAASGRPGTLEIDINFLLRTPLWPIVIADSRPVGSISAQEVPVLDTHELVAGKLVALFSRGASRDLFDVRESLRRGGLDRSRLRTGFVVYGGINRRDWRTISCDDVKAEPREVDRQLLPLLRGDFGPARTNLVQWTYTLVSDCKDLLSIVLPFEPHEHDFLARLNECGEIAPDLLTQDSELLAIIRSHPGLLWKALNVRRHRGLDDGGADAR